MKTISIFNNVSELPEQWDALAECYFRQKIFLLHAEKFNPCKQRYYVFEENGAFKAGAVVYTLRLDLLTYLRIKSPLKMHIIGIPCSVSSSGIFGESDAIEALKEYIYNAEKGFVLCLNLNEKSENALLASGHTLPTIVFNNSFESWADYISKLRYPYRRRLKNIEKSFQEIHLEKLSCHSFTEDMHKLYLEVYNRSKGKLEKLDYNFFKNLPDEFMLTVCYFKNELIGWHITLNHNLKHYFFLGGINYNYNKKFNIYFMLLTEIIKDGINKKADFIELGQTAEVPKIRLGGKAIPLFMEAHHSNRLFHFFLRKFSGLMTYKREIEKTKSFKEESS